MAAVLFTFVGSLEDVCPQSQVELTKDLCDLSRRRRTYIASPASSTLPHDRNISIPPHWYNYTVIVMSESFFASQTSKAGAAFALASTAAVSAYYAWPTVSGAIQRRLGQSRGQSASSGESSPAPVGPSEKSKAAQISAFLSRFPWRKTDDSSMPGDGPTSPPSRREYLTSLDESILQFEERYKNTDLHTVRASELYQHGRRLHLRDLFSTPKSLAAERHTANTLTCARLGEFCQVLGDSGDLRQDLVSWIGDLKQDLSPISEIVRGPHTGD